MTYLQLNPSNPLLNLFLPGVTAKSNRPTFELPHLTGDTLRDKHACTVLGVCNIKIMFIIINFLNDNGYRTLCISTGF